MTPLRRRAGGRRQYEHLRLGQHRRRVLLRGWRQLRLRVRGLRRFRHLRWRARLRQQVLLSMPTASGYAHFGEGDLGIDARGNESSGSCRTEQRQVPRAGKPLPTESMEQLPVAFVQTYDTPTRSSSTTRRRGTRSPHTRAARASQRRRPRAAGRDIQVGRTNPEHRPDRPPDAGGEIVRTPMSPRRAPRHWWRARATAATVRSTTSSTGSDQLRGDDDGAGEAASSSVDGGHRDRIAAPPGVRPLHGEGTFRRRAPGDQVHDARPDDSRAQALVAPSTSSDPQSTPMEACLPAGRGAPPARLRKKPGCGTNAAGRGEASRSSGERRARRSEEIDFTMTCLDGGALRGAVRR